MLVEVINWWRAEYITLTCLFSAAVTSATTPTAFRHTDCRPRCRVWQWKAPVAWTNAIDCGKWQAGHFELKLEQLNNRRRHLTIWIIRDQKVTSNGQKYTVRVSAEMHLVYKHSLSGIRQPAPKIHGGPLKPHGFFNIPRWCNYLNTWKFKIFTKLCRKFGVPTHLLSERKPYIIGSIRRCNVLWNGSLLDIYTLFNSDFIFRRQCQEQDNLPLPKTFR